MKKIVVVSFICLFLFTSCSSQNVMEEASQPDTLNIEKSEEAKSNEIKATEETIIEGLYSYETATYQLTEKKLSNKKSHYIVYPVLSEFKGELLKDYINQDIEKYVDQLVRLSSGAYIDVDYKITRESERILSILFKGKMVLNNEDSEILHALNFDLSTSNLMDTRTIISKNENSRLMLSAIFNQNAKLQLGDIAPFEIGDEFGYYLTEDKIVFFFQNLSLGNHFIEVELNLVEVKDFLNTDFGEIPAS